MRESARFSWEVRASGAKRGEAFIYGNVVSSKWYEEDVTAESFNSDLKALGDIDELDVYINSYGGSVFQGQAIYSILRRHKAHKTVYVDGIAASIASVIAMAGDVVKMPRNASMMIHNPMGLAFGNATEMRKTADELDKLREGMLAAYLAKTGEKTTEEELVELLDAETWLNADECFDLGFVDEVIEAKEVAACGDPVLLARYKNVPEELIRAVAATAPSVKDEQRMREDMQRTGASIGDYVRQILGGI